jgi:DNA-binding GntR family transcriptional regulator
LNERLLCERLGISRTPLRESIKTLAAEGLVELQPNRGAIVSLITVSKVRETFAVMAALETLTGELACQNASDVDIAEIRALHYQMIAHYKRGELPEYFRCNQMIHLRLIDSTGNATLAQTYRQLNGQVRRARYRVNLSAERWAEAVAEHEAILAALDARDAEQLKRLLREHLGDQMIMVLATLESSQAGSEPRADRRERRA